MEGGLTASFAAVRLKTNDSGLTTPRIFYIIFLEYTIYMTTFVAFLRGINVGGNTMLSMKDLAAICADIGFKDVSTYINSGNVIFKSTFVEEKLQTKLEKALFEKKGKKFDVVIRDASELTKIISNNLFPAANPSRVGILLFSEPVPKDFTEGLNDQGPEKVKAGKREVYVYYPNGMGRTKLKLPPSAKRGTVRNMNTITKLSEKTKK